MSETTLSPDRDPFSEQRAKLRPWLLIEEPDANGLDWQTAADAKHEHESTCTGCRQDRCDQ